MNRPHRVYLLSPADCGGRRVTALLAGRSVAPMAVRLRDGGAPLGDVFAYVSTLYFRGKLAYAGRFAWPPADADGVLVITPGAGLVPAHRAVTLADLATIAAVPVDARDARFSTPLARDATVLGRTMAEGGEIVLLGSLAPRKYLDVLLPVLADRLLVPEAFVGLGEMQRGSLLLRRAAAGRPLAYVRAGAALAGRSS
jgi:hypothetical protein